MRPLVDERLGSLGFDASATASAAAESEVKSQIKSGDIDAAGAADATARAVAKAAGAAAGAAACAATGAGAAVAPLCGSAGAWVADELYGPVKKFFSGLFGGESEAAKFRRKLTAAQQRKAQAWGDMQAMSSEAKRTVDGIVRALYEERKELGLTPYSGWNDVVSALRSEGLPVTVAQSWVDLSKTTGEWRKTQSTDPFTSLPMTEVLSWYLPNGSSPSHKEFQARPLKRVAKEKFLKNQFDQMATELADWITKARDTAAIVAAKNAGEAAKKLEPEAVKIIRRPPALKPVVTTPVRKPPAMAPAPSRKAPVAPSAVPQSTPETPATTAPSQGAYGPYPQPGAVGVSWRSSDAWRWFSVRDRRGAPVTQRGPVWMSDDAALREEAELIESAQRHGAFGDIARWDWDSDAYRWQQARG